MPRGLRYRVDGDRTCIDMALKSARQLFDLRDPSPFRERDLEDDAVEYLTSSAREIGRSAKLKVVFTISGPRDPVLDEGEVIAAVRAHLDYERDRQARKIRELIERGQRALAVGVAALALLLSAAELAKLLPASHASQILQEGLVITGWVAMWRPLEILLYEWWPHLEQRRLFERLLAADIVVVHVAEPSGSART